MPINPDGDAVWKEAVPAGVRVITCLRLCLCRREGGCMFMEGVRCVVEHGAHPLPFVHTYMHYEEHAFTPWDGGLVLVRLASTPREHIHAEPTLSNILPLFAELQVHKTKHEIFPLTCKGLKTIAQQGTDFPGKLCLALPQPQSMHQAHQRINTT